MKFGTFEKIEHMKRIIYAIGLLVSLLGTQVLEAQKKNDATLFTFGSTPVGKSEFLRMYTKNINNQKPDFSEKAVREYLTLFSRFKMKVAEAEEQRMDTLPSIQTELGTYKKQLAKTYLTDKEVTDRLVKEAYERMKKDVHVAHILVAVPRGSDDTTAAWRKIDSIYKALSSGKEEFGTMAKVLSDDKQSALNSGDIGFITAMQIVYPFESVAYNTPVGSFSKPFKTIFGYHILKKLEERPARGEIQVAQIMVAVQKSSGREGEAAGKARIDSVYTMLKKGQNFEKLVERYSEDKYSKNSQGTLASFGVGQMVPDFENAAFALKNPGDISEPVRTEYGFHILKLIRKMPIRPFDTVKGDLTRRVEKDGRIDVARQEFTEKIKGKVSYKEFPTALNQLISAIPDSTLRNGAFKGADYGSMHAPLFTMTGVTFTQADFANYIEAYSHGKMYGPKESSLKSLFKNYSDKALYDYQENRLIDDNEEYRNLLTEYRDGIMLFELTDRTVWTKASVDTTGLDEYYQQNKSKYMWQPAVKGNLYKAADESYAKKLVKELNNPMNKTTEEVVKAANGDGPQNRVVVETGKFEKTKFPASTKLVAGKYAPYYKNEDGTYSVIDVKEVYDTPTQKTLGEARGYVISEYQEYLEKQWISNLEAKYPVVVNEPVLKTIIKK